MGCALASADSRAGSINGSVVRNPVGWMFATTVCGKGEARVNGCGRGNAAAGAGPKPGSVCGFGTVRSNSGASPPAPLGCRQLGVVGDAGIVGLIGVGEPGAFNVGP